MDINNKTFWKEFIEIYKENRCLWDLKSKDYTNKMKRNYSYSILLNKFKELYPEGTKEVMKKKLNNIRTCFRREFKKAEDSKRTGNGPDDIYQPSLWYFDLLLFTIEGARERKRNPDEDEESDKDTEADVNNLYKEETEDYLPNTPVSDEESIDIQKNIVSQSLLRPCFETTMNSKSAPRKRVFTQQTNKNVGGEKKMALYNVAHLAFPVEENNDDEFNTTGKRFAYQLKKLDDRQRLIAEKLWADIIFYGAQGKLEIDCAINFPSNL